MKFIPYELKQKLLKNLQVQSTDANPALRVVATQSTTNDRSRSESWTDEMREAARQKRMKGRMNADGQ